MEKIGEMSSSSTRKHDFFFKILLGDFQNRLRIPKSFINHFPKESRSSVQAILEGPSSCYWHVKLKRTTKAVYLEDGWEIFSRDHSLQKNDFLLFAYDGNEHFSVRIFDTSACERKDAFLLKSQPFAKEKRDVAGHRQAIYHPRQIWKGAI